MREYRGRQIAYKERDKQNEQKHKNQLSSSSMARNRNFHHPCGLSSKSRLGRERCPSNLGLSCYPNNRPSNCPIFPPNQVINTRKGRDQMTRLDKRPLPKLSTYTILTGTTYEVEAKTEEEALARFFDWYGSDKQEFTDTICEEGEALTIVYDHD